MENPVTMFVAFGTDQCVLDLADGRLSGTVVQRIVIGDEIR